MARTGRPVALLIGGVGLLAAALLLWALIASGEDGASASPTPVAVAPASPQAPPASPRRGDDRPGRPQIAPSEEARRSGGSRAATETVVDGVIIRDHRKDRSKPIALPDRPPPKHARKIPPELTREVTNRLLPIVRACASSVPPEARGAKPRVEGTVVIAIRNGQVQVSQAAIELTDVVGAPADPAKQCIEQQTLGVTAPAADEADLDDYPIRIRFALP